MEKLSEYVGSLKSKLEVAKVKAFIATMQLAESFAKRNATKQFTGRNGRTLTGNLLNSIYVDYKIQNNKLTGSLGVRNIPYGAIHEFGGTIEPVKAQKLWIPQYKNAKKMTPREFMNLRKSNPREYFLNDKVAGQKIGTRTIVPFFYLVDKVTIPERPYLRPAMEEAQGHYNEYLAKFMAEV